MLLITSETVLPPFGIWYYMNEDDRRQLYYVISAIASLSVGWSLLSTFWCWYYVNNEQPLWWYYLTYRERFAIAVLSVVWLCKAFGVWYQTSNVDHRAWFCLTSVIALLTTSGFFLPALWRWHFVNTENLRTVISMLFSLGAFLPAFRCWFHLNDD